MQHLKVKPKIAYAFMVAIRMVPLIFTSLIQLRRSLKMRYQMIDASNYRGLKRLKHLLIPILSQNIRRAHQLSVAMESKGFKDGPRTYYYKAPFSYKDILFVICVVAILIIAFYLSQYFPITGITDARVSGYTHKIGRITVHQDTPYFTFTYSMPYFQYHDDKIGYHS